MDLPALIIVAMAYFVGGLPMGVLVARSRGVDIFKVGSGNVGTTNVVRALGFKWGIIVWLGDVGKGAVATLLAVLTHRPEAIMAAGAAAILGHCWSPYLRLRGGRGIATSLGVLLVVDWRVGLTGFGVWIVVMLISRIVSLASLVAAVALLPLTDWLHPTAPMFVLAGFMTCLTFYRHRPNIERLLRGEERPFGRHRSHRTPTPQKGPAADSAKTATDAEEEPDAPDAAVDISEA